jgi:hypothetical protein
MDTTKDIWEYLFLARVPYLQSRTIAEMKKYGVRLSGVKSEDANIKNEWLTTYMSIAQMVDYHKDGVPVRIVDPSELPKMYEFISRHLTLWKHQLEVGINIGDAPIDDLVAMDNFATTLYDQAVHQFTREIAESAMAKHLLGLTSLNRQNLFRKEGITKYLASDTTNQDDLLSGHVSRYKADKPPERESMGDFFKDKIMSFRRY